MGPRRTTYLGHVLVKKHIFLSEYIHFEMACLVIGCIVFVGEYVVVRLTGRKIILANKLVCEWLLNFHGGIFQSETVHTSSRSRTPQSGICFSPRCVCRVAFLIFHALPAESMDTGAACASPDEKFSSNSGVADFEISEWPAACFVEVGRTRFWQGKLGCRCRWSKP